MSKSSNPHMRGDFPYQSVDDIEYANNRAGYHYFEASTMRFFNSRVLHGVYGGRYFVTSERCDWGPYQRTYTVREALPSGRVETVGEFEQFSSARAARRCAENIPDGHSVYFAQLVVWAREHAGGDWRRAADYCGASYKRGDSTREQRARINADRAELRRMFRKYAREVSTVILP